MSTERLAQYLLNIAEAVDKLSMVSCSGKYTAETVDTVIAHMKECEENTNEFIADASVDKLVPNAVRYCKNSFIRSNQRVIDFLIKNQPQGFNYKEIVKALRLENKTLKEEISL